MRKSRLQLKDYFKLNRPILILTHDRSSFPCVHIKHRVLLVTKIITSKIIDNKKRKFFTNRNLMFLNFL